ncbi:DUF2927 domain-containing protein [Actinoplanes sp. NPDC049681]|uniref:DUF2927 domain-containing protein n=1 Tax=Actinoplanes sp. NPDC049681 TaxID=3363905 RepID=UPI0037995AB8
MRPALLRLLSPALLAAVLATAGCDAGPTRAAGAPATSGPAASASAPAPASPPAPPKPRVSKATLAYFFKIALGAEYGDDVKVVIKWSQPVVTVRLEGKPDAPARTCLQRVVADFNELSATTRLRLTTDSTADIRMYFGPVSRFRSVEPSYVPGNDGFFTVAWRGDHTISNGTVLIRTTGIGDRVRCHLIREELTQSMGLMRDADDHPDSVFYGEYWAMPTKYSGLDEKLIRLLYGGALRPGDTRKDITAAVTVAG